MKAKSIDLICEDRGHIKRKKGENDDQMEEIIILTFKIHQMKEHTIKLKDNTQTFEHAYITTIKNNDIKIKKTSVSTK